MWRGMILDELPSLAGFAAALRRADTLEERGVAAPFLTPVLAGARLRAADGGRTGSDVLLPHPAGREGSYVIPWAAALQECRPAYADRLLVAYLQGSPISPRPVWQAARRVAAEGLYGRAARLAGVTAEALASARREELARRLAARARGAEALAPGLLACGTADSPGGRAVATVNRVARMARDLARWAADDAPTDEDRRRAEQLAAAAERAAGSAARLAAEAQAMVADPASLLRDPARAEAALRAGERPGWALNGFAFLAALWGEAGPCERAGVVRLGARLVPPPAGEMLAWPGFAAWEALAPTQPPRLPPALLERALGAWLAP